MPQPGALVQCHNDLLAGGSARCAVNSDASPYRVIRDRGQLTLEGTPCGATGLTGASLLFECTLMTASQALAFAVI